MTRQKLTEIFNYLDISFNSQTTVALNVDCPFCSDEGKHCGVFFETLRFTCWKCKAKGSLFDLLSQTHALLYKEYERLIYEALEVSDASAVSQINAIIAEVKNDLRSVVETEPDWPPSGTVPLQSVVNNAFVRSFIERRRLDIDYCIYRGVAIGCTGRYMNRFIIPVIHDRAVVGYQARSMMQAMEPRYLTAGRVFNYLYDYDEINEHKPAVIVEGIFDKWRTGENAIASFSHMLTGSQVLLLREKHPTEWVLCWDSDSYWQIREAAENLRSVLSEPVRIVELPEGYDPDALGKENPERLRGLLYGE